VKLQKQPNVWSCFPTALAIALDVPVANIIKEVGHDGSEIIWSKLEDPHRRRGFHVQEMQIVALNHYYVMSYFEFAPCSAPSLTEMPYTISGMGDVIVELMMKYTGVILGYGKAKIAHAVAWDGAQCYDPNGTIYPIQDFEPTTFLPLIEIDNVSGGV